MAAKFPQYDIIGPPAMPDGLLMSIDSMLATNISWTYMKHNQQNALHNKYPPASPDTPTYVTNKQMHKDSQESNGFLALLRTPKQLYLLPYLITKLCGNIWVLKWFT